MKTRLFVWVTFRLRGFHRWPGAPAHSYYLRAAHRHEFHFKVRLKVTHANRDVEFHDLQHHCMRLVQAIYPHRFQNTSDIDFQTDSCEHIAERLGNQLVERYTSPVIVEVSEDGENGSSVIIEPS